MENLMDRFSWGDGWRIGHVFKPQADLVETDDAFEVTLDLPGLKPEDVNVELIEGRLSISGERKEEKEEECKTFHRVERRTGEFRRILTLPCAVNEEEVSAEFNDGVLTVRVLKSEEARTKRIEVKG